MKDETHFLLQQVKCLKCYIDDVNTCYIFSLLAAVNIYRCLSIPIEKDTKKHNSTVQE